MAMDPLLKMQRGEATETLIYARLARRARPGKNRQVLERISADEHRHYGMLREITKKEAEPDTLKVGLYVLLASFFGLSFGLKLMERGEGNAQSEYRELEKRHHELGKVLLDEERHENDLLNIITEERLDYASSIVLGLNDALVELTGALAGLTLALANGSLIAISGLVIGVAGALSMAASSYLSAKEENQKNAVTAATYTGIAYLLTVLLLVLPFFIFDSEILAISVTLLLALIIIASYTFYVTTARDRPFLPKFIEMAALCLGVAAISFAFGFLLKQFTGQ